MHTYFREVIIILQVYLALREVDRVREDRLEGRSSFSWSIVAVVDFDERFALGVFERCLGLSS